MFEEHEMERKIRSSVTKLMKEQIRLDGYFAKLSKTHEIHEKSLKFRSHLYEAIAMASFYKYVKIAVKRKPVDKSKAKARKSK